MTDLGDGGGHTPIAVIDRNGVDESVHHGTVIVRHHDGTVEVLAGRSDLEIYPRSSLKPLQATALLRAGAKLDDRQLALACASHDGTSAHLDVVRSTLASVGLDTSDLRTTPDLPLDRGAAEAWIAAGGVRESIAMNCSGKHAAMLATCVSAGWPTLGHLDPSHPLQQFISEVIADLSGEPVRHVGIDGCGAPTHLMGVTALATAIAGVATAQGPVWSAMTTHPELVGGSERPATVLMRAVPGLMAKDGAEGVFVAAIPSGPSVVVKVADGASRAAAVVAAAALGYAGVAVPSGIGSQLSQPALGGGEVVGRLRSLL
jgi:L-asparaginase II